jgi:hypothetical protein
MIPQESIASLAELFDRYVNAFDPTTADSMVSKKAFHELLSSLHATHASDVEFTSFRYEAIKLCREYLKKN